MTPLRRWGLTFLLLSVLGFALAVATLPWLRPDKYGLAALFFLIAALIWGGRALWHWPARSYWAVAIAAVVLIPAVVIARGFGRVDMMAVAFHADFGTEGATLDGLQSEIIAAVLSAGLIALSLALIAALWSLTARSLLPAAVVLLAVNPFAQFAASWAVTPTVVSDLGPNLHPPVLLVNETGQSNPDLVMVYIEGTDRQFADPAVWGDVYAPLSKLAAEGQSFTGVGQIAGTGWSLAGMIATQCGVPVLPRGLIYRNNFDKLETFLPAQICLGDVLSQRGYQTAYVVGGDLGFGGIRTFYNTHKITDLTGIEEQKKLYPPDEIEAASIGWMLDDQLVFETARQKTRELMQGTAPFALLVETIGPHGHNGFLSRECGDSGQGEKSHDAARVLRCTIGETVAFVDFLRAEHAKARPGQGLRIVLMSDHLSHNPDTPDTAPGFKGTNTVIFLGGPDEPGAVISNAGAMIDVYPTLLHWLGLSAPPHKAGLGRSLLADAPTLTAERGIPTMDAMLMVDTALADKVWAEP